MGVRSIHIIGIGAGVIMMMASACLKPGDAAKIGKTASVTNTSGNLQTGATGGARVAVVRFSTSNNGSFRPNDVPQGGVGTDDEYGSGVPAVRLWGANNTGNPIADAGNGALPENISSIAGWPAWIERIEVGLSGANNPRYKQTNCMKFAGADLTPNCNTSTPDLAANNYVSNCRAPEGKLAMSEKNCHRNVVIPAAVPNAAQLQLANDLSDASDLDTGIFIRVAFKRSELGASENILVDLKYYASTWNSPPSNPRGCFNSSGVYTPNSPTCTDLAWAAYLSAGVGSLSSMPVQPFLWLAPPAAHAWRGGMGEAPDAQTENMGFRVPVSQQIIIPLSSDPDAKFLELTRRHIYWPTSQNSIPTGLEGQYPFGRQSGLVWPTKSINACGDDSPFCAGIVFDSLSLYRI